MLNGLTFPDTDQVQGFPPVLEVLLRVFFIDFNVREGIVVNAYNVLAIDEISGFAGIFDAHREVVPDW